MEIGRSYYVVRAESGEYPPVLGDDDDTRLVVFTDYEDALERAKGEGVGTVVEHMPRKEVHQRAREQGVEYILLVDKEGNREVELVEVE